MRQLIHIVYRIYMCRCVLRRTSACVRKWSCVLLLRFCPSVGMQMTTEKIIRNLCRTDTHTHSCTHTSHAKHLRLFYYFIWAVGCITLKSLKMAFCKYLQICATEFLINKFFSHFFLSGSKTTKHICICVFHLN